jgi:hypothetical protein
MLVALLPARSGLAFGPACAAYPFTPACCPPPCPVNDQAKITEFLGDAEQAWHKVEQCRAIGDQYLQLLATLGPNGPIAAELRRLPGNVTVVFASVGAALPAILRPADLVDPRATSERVKQTMFEPAGRDGVTLTDRVGNAAELIQTVADETADGLATGLHAYGRLTDVALDGGQRIVAASRAADARSDWAANIAARQALVDNLVGLRQLLSSWAAIEAMTTASVQSTAAGPLPAASISTSPLAPVLAAQADQIARLRRVRAAVNQMDATISALASLHNERHAANIMLAQYAGLLNSVSSHDAAVQFRSNDEAAAVDLLGQVFADPQAVFGVVREQLLVLDRTGWQDSGLKDQAAAAAAQAVVQALTANPQAFGAIGDSQATVSNDVRAALAASFSAWLEDDKLERFWHPLRTGAEAAIGSLDRRLAQVTQRRGFDIAGTGAAEQEADLIARFNRQLAQLSTAGTASLSDSQRVMVSSLAAAFRSVAAAAQGDAAAANFVSVVWPQ